MYPVKQLSVLVLVLLLFATACTSNLTKDDYIHNYEAWVSKLKQHYKDYKDADWSWAEVEFKRYGEKEYCRFKDDLTPDERQKVDRLSGQYYAMLAKFKANQVKDEINSIMNKAKGMFEELQKDNQNLHFKWMVR